MTPTHNARQISMEADDTVLRACEQH